MFQQSQPFETINIIYLINLSTSKLFNEVRICGNLCNLCPISKNEISFLFNSLCVFACPVGPEDRTGRLCERILLTELGNGNEQN